MSNESRSVQKRSKSADQSTEIHSTIGPGRETGRSTDGSDTPGHGSDIHPARTLQRIRGNQVVQRLVEERVRPVIGQGQEAKGSEDEYEIDTGEAKHAMAQSDTGTPLSSTLRTQLGQSFGTNLSDVHVHTDRAAQRASSALNARAFTAGRDVFFGEGEYSPTSRRGQELLAHEVWHVVQQEQGRVKPAVERHGVSINDEKGLEREADRRGAEAVGRLNPSASADVDDEWTGRGITPASRTVQRQETGKSESFEEYVGRSINTTGHVSAPAGQYQIAKSQGVNLRAKPDGTLPPISRVIYDTEVQVQASDNTDQFYFVVAGTGEVGWINKDFVVLNPPAPGSTLHHITEDNLTTILENEYVKTNRWTLDTGNDYTTLAAAVIVANEGRKGVSVDWAKARAYKEDHPFKSRFDPWMIDNFAIYHASEIRSGHNIWLPPPEYVRMLQSSGTIGSRPAWINAAVNVGKGIAGFYAGVVSGIFGSLWDTLTGLWDLGKTIVDTVKGALDGSLFAALEEIYAKITSMSWKDVKEMVSEIVTMGESAFDDFKKQWEHPDIFKQYHFKGYIVGAVALEVVLAVFSGGAALGAKVLAKVGKYFPKLMRVLNKLLDLADRLPGRRRGDRDGGSETGEDRPRDRDESKDNRGWNQALALARLVTEQHDAMDTPVEELIPLLNSTIAAKFKPVNRYEANLISPPNTHEIIQRVKKDHVDKHYTGKKKSSKRSRPFLTDLWGKSAKYVKERARAAGWVERNLESGQGWKFVDQNGVERFRYRYVTKDKGQYLHENTGYVRWKDENGYLLDIDGNRITAAGEPLKEERLESRVRKLIGDEEEVERVMRESHISVGIIGGTW